MGRTCLLVLPLLIANLLFVSTVAGQEEQMRVFLRMEGSAETVEILSAAENRFKSPILEAGGLVFAGTAEMESVFAECREDMGVNSTTERECQLQAANRISVEQLFEVGSRPLLGGRFELALKVWEPGSNAELYTAFVEIEAADLETAALEGLPRLAAKYLSWNRPSVNEGSAVVSAGAVLDRGTSIVNEVVDDTGFLTIRSEPSGATIFINGEQKAQTPWRDELMVGRYVIVVENGSLYDAGRQELQLDTGGATMNFKLVPRWGSLVVESEPSGAEVYLDGVLIGSTPMTDTQRSSGAYQLRIRKAGYLDGDAQIEVKDGEKTEHHVVLERNAGEVVVKSEPSGAKVFLDGKETGRETPAIFDDLQPGTYVITLRLDGYGEAVEKVKVERGKQNAVFASLDAKLGVLSVLSDYEDGTPCDGKLYIDGVLRGTTPAKLDVLATSHEITVSCPEGEAKTGVVVEHNKKDRVNLVITRAGHETVAIAPRPEHDVQTPDSVASTNYGWVILGAGGVLAGAGSILYFVSEQQIGDINTSMTQVEAQQAQDDAEVLNTWGMVGLGVGGAVVVAGLILVFTDDNDQGSDSVGLGVAPWADQRGSGVVVGGRF